jgi:hypothetical protein
MDKLQWFKFTPSDWMMGKIQRCPEVTQARFLRLCCLYWNKECEISIDDAIIEIDKEHFDILKSKKIISVNDTHFNISFLDEQFLEINENAKSKSNNGIIGNLKRWHPTIYSKFESKEISLNEAIKQSQSIASQSLPDSNPIAKQSQSIADKNREDKIIKDNIKDINTRKREFYNSLIPFLDFYSKDMLKDFFEYWSEHGENDKKFRKEKEKSFNLELRLKTWFKRSKEFKEKNVAPKKEKENAGTLLMKKYGLS